MEGEGDTEACYVVRYVMLCNIVCMLCCVLCCVVSCLSICVSVCFCLYTTPTHTHPLHACCIGFRSCGWVHVYTEFVTFWQDNLLQRRTQMEINLLATTDCRRAVHDDVLALPSLTVFRDLVASVTGSRPQSIHMIILLPNVVVHIILGYAVAKTDEVRTWAAVLDHIYADCEGRKATLKTLENETFGPIRKKIPPAVVCFYVGVYVYRVHCVVVVGGVWCLLLRCVSYGVAPFILCVCVCVCVCCVWT